MAGPPDHITRGRLVAGDLDGGEMEIEPGQETIEMFGMGVVLSSRPSENEHLGRGDWVYRFVRVEGAVAIFEFVERRERP